MQANDLHFAESSESSSLPEQLDPPTASNASNEKQPTAQSDSSAISKTGEPPVGDGLSDEQDEELKKVNNAEKLLKELMMSVEQGEPTSLVQALIAELSSRVKLNLGPQLASQILGTSTTTGVELINSILADPQILWKRQFFTELRKLPSDQVDVLLYWFTQMTELQTIYISEIEKANDFLKLMVCKSFDGLNASESIKQEFIMKINHIENRPYFHRKRQAIRASRPDVNAERSDTPEPKSLDLDKIRGLSGVRLPHKVEPEVRQPPKPLEGKSVDFNLSEQSSAQHEPVRGGAGKKASDDASLMVEGLGQFFDKFSSSFESSAQRTTPKSILRKRPSEACFESPRNSRHSFAPPPQWPSTGRVYDRQLNYYVRSGQQSRYLNYRAVPQQAASYHEAGFYSTLSRYEQQRMYLQYYPPRPQFWQTARRERHPAYREVYRYMPN